MGGPKKGEKKNRGEKAIKGSPISLAKKGLSLVTQEKGKFKKMKRWKV